MSKYLSKDQILGAQDLAHEDVEVPEWAGVVRVWALTGGERSQYQASLVSVDAEGNRNIVLRDADVKLAALSIKDENGVRLFGYDEVDALGAKSAAALDRVVNAAQRLSAMRPEDIKEMQAALKAESSASTTTSPAS